ncbi:TPA: hypothetical protein N0F65_004495 [Lagenidium giganteum]|uniref:UDENN domain-containing protein n=1 Tax=Lagenidium giganteum TaxID=4803 RepID=A0AAV2ZBR1_9STRA|nr:TPA: hypothetical protein N0F65_004495 [Lagenidium giganteum]
MRSISSLDAWLFGEDKDVGAQRSATGTQHTPQPHVRRPQVPSHASDPQLATSSRSNSLPANSISLSNLRAQRGAKKTSLSAPAGRNSVASHSDLSYPFPVSSRLRKLFRPNRLQWNRSRGSVGMSADEKQRHLLGISATSYQKLQGHVPFTLKEVVKDPKKLPYLLRWLSSDDNAESTKTNYHQVLLFLLEIEQLQLVTEDKQKEQALKIWNKYIDHGSEFQIATTLELTTELEQLVREGIESPERVLDGFFPIQKLAYMRLTREEMPKFLKSTEYLQMLVDTENDTESVPMERILEVCSRFMSQITWSLVSNHISVLFVQQPRAAHYFLLFLMQSRQHFELYFWLHVEYVLKPLLESESYPLFWKLAHVLEKKAQYDSQAITLATKTDLQQAIATKAMDTKVQPPQPVATAVFTKAQQEIFVMLRSSWFDRFMKSNLYKVALKDSLIHLERDESKEDSPPKLITRSYSTVTYPITEDAGEGNDDTEADDKASNDLNDIAQEEAGSGSDSADSSEESDDFSKMALDLESIIRLTNLPDGLQVHYRPNFDAPTASFPEFRSEKDMIVHTVVTFATFVEKHENAEPTPTLMLMPVTRPQKSEDSSDNDESLPFDDTSKRIKPFLVPDARMLIKKSERCRHKPKDIIFPFQQSGRNGFLYGSVYLTYEQVRVGTHSEEYFVAKGVCILSRYPLVTTLRLVLERHVVGSQSASDAFSHERLTALFSSSISSVQSPLRDGPKCLQPKGSMVDLPLSISNPVDVSLQPFFDCFGIALGLQILASALLECSVVLVSNQYTLLTSCAEAIRCLLRPYSWCHVYAPVLPQLLLSYLQCPTPILVGVHSSYASRSDLPSSGFYLVADMDRQVVEYVGNQSLSWRRVGLVDDRCTGIFLPRAFEQAKQELDALLNPTRQLFDAVGSDKPCKAEVAFPENRVREICLDLFGGLLRGHSRACLVVGDTRESVVIFDETQFLSSLDPEDEGFYKLLMRTQCFSEIISAHRIEMAVKETEELSTTTDPTPNDIEDFVI